MDDNKMPEGEMGEGMEETKTPAEGEETEAAPEM